MQLVYMYYISTSGNNKVISSTNENFRVQCEVVRGALDLPLMFLVVVVHRHCVVVVYDSQ